MAAPMQGVPLQTFMQALQPTQVVLTGNPFMAPQYPMAAPFLPQAPPVAQVPASIDHPFYQSLIATISEKVMKDIKKQDAPADMSPENEKILVNALKKGKENQWPMERIFQDLSQNHGYTKNVWMEWFTLNVHKLYSNFTFNPEANSERGARGDDASGSGSGSSGSQAVSSTSTVSKNRPTSTFKFAQEHSQSRARKVVIATPKPPGSGQTKSTTSALEQVASSSNNEPSTNSTRTPSTNTSPALQNTFSVPTRYSAHRSKRGGLVLPIVHDQTVIPWTDGSTKPSPPTRSEGSTKLPLPRGPGTSAAPTSGDSGNGKLTDDEKIFFVHWLRWRLREGPLPEKETLFEELEDELPHRAAETWKRHWGSHCEVPDGIYIEARKRVERGRAQRVSQRTAPPATSAAAVAAAPAAEPGEQSDGSDSESDSGDDYDNVDSDHGDDAPAAATATRSRPTSRKSRPPGGLPVTDEDLRAMARYRFAMGSDWDRQRFKVPRWQAFADRPENHKRSPEAWYSITRDARHSAVIDQYVKELERSQAVSAVAAPRRSKPGLPGPAAPQQTRPVPVSTSSAGAAKQAAAPNDNETALKRPHTGGPGAGDNAGGDGAGNSDAPPSKKMRRDVGPADVMDLTADSESED